MEERFVNACRGKSKSQGGMNIQEFKEAITFYFGLEEDEIANMTRKELEMICNQLDESNSPRNEKEEDRYFLPGNPLTKEQKKYCRCIAHVSAKNPENCYRDGEWEKGPKSAGCVNPYSVCTKSTKRKGRFKCAPYYNLDRIPRKEVEGIAKLHDKSVQEMKAFIAEERKKEGWSNPNY
jgi:hypothetical protein